MSLWCIWLSSCNRTPKNHFKELILPEPATHEVFSPGESEVGRGHLPRRWARLAPFILNICYIPPGRWKMSIMGETKLKNKLPAHFVRYSRRKVQLDILISTISVLLHFGALDLKGLSSSYGCYLKRDNSNGLRSTPNREVWVEPLSCVVFLDKTFHSCSASLHLSVWTNPAPHPGENLISSSRFMLGRLGQTHGLDQLARVRLNLSSNLVRNFAFSVARRLNFYNSLFTKIINQSICNGSQMFNKQFHSIYSSNSKTQWID